MTHRPGQPRGFTLIEVMIAAAILAAMGGIVFGMFSRAWNQKQEVEAIDQRYGQIRSAMDRMALEISEAFISDHYDHKRYRERPTIFRGRSSGGADELAFTAMANERLEADSKTSDQALITYSLDNDPNGSGDKVLFRRSNPVIDEDADRHGRKQVICSGIKALKFEYWNTTRLDWDDEWDAAHTEHMGVLPERVRITITFTDETGRDRRLTTQSKILMQRSLNF
jgi:general secretion pathway protein J